MSDKDDILNSAQPGKSSEHVSLNNEGGQLDEDRLMAYLEGKLPPGEQHEIEQWLSDEGMESDALEGLKMLDAAETKQSVNKLNTDLRKRTGNKKRNKREAKPEYTSLIAIIVIIMLAVVAFIVIKMIK